LPFIFVLSSSSITSARATLTDNGPIAAIVTADIAAEMVVLMSPLAMFIPAGSTGRR
jgi:hypothetical protein